MQCSSTVSTTRLPLGRLAVLLAPAWIPVLVLAPLPIVLFPDGRIPPGRWAWVFWSYVAVAVTVLAGLGVADLHAFTRQPSGYRFVRDRWRR